MKIVISVDSFKGSLTSMEAGAAIRAGILRAQPDAEIVVKPLADGGEGTTDALIEGLGGTRIDLTVTGPLGQPVQAHYGYLKDSNTAIIEMASAAGIMLVPDGRLNPLSATTYGVGELIRHAIEMGCRNFIIGIGGSATNDAGLGMLKALGFRFPDREGRDVGDGAKALAQIAAVDRQQVHPLLKDCFFQVACDVNNPLCGINGSTYIYGPQKGVTEEMKPELDRAMAHFADITADTVNKDWSKTAGAGAAGGLGFAFLSYLNAELTSGVELILDTVNLEQDLKDADIVITGEGRLDYQTAMGKAPIGVAKRAKRYGAKVIAFAGSVNAEARSCNQAGIDAFFPAVHEITTLEEAMLPQNASKNLTLMAEQVFRLLQTCKK